jgi:hypothetical protein
MTGLPTELYNRCRTTLLKCSEFDSNTALRAVFVTDELSPFRSGLPEAMSKSGRVGNCLAFLLDKRLSDGQPVLPMFLTSLRDRYQEGDALRDELETLRLEVEQYALINSPTSVSVQRYPQRAMKNPYTERAMITDATMFFGRSEELESIFSRLTTLQSCSIVGQRRIGKSSLLYHLCQPEIYRDRIPSPTQCAFAYFDLQTVGKPTRKRFFSLVLRKFAQASRQHLRTDYQPTYDGFRTFIEDSHDAGWGLVLCLDEFEVICGRGEFDSDFFAFLRGLGNSYNLAYVTTSCSVLHELCHTGKIASSQFWNIFTTLHLGHLRDGEARDLVTVPFARSEVALSIEDVDFVLRLADRHPLLLQIACYHLFEARQMDVVDYAQVEAEFRQETAPYFDYIWGSPAA